MTQQTKSGETLEKGEGLKIDESTKYEYGANLETDGVRIEDAGVGRQVLIRVFDFTMNPAMKDFDKQTIFNNHAKQLSTILWSDGLRPIESEPPRVILDKKKCMYQIFVACEGRLGQTFIDKPRNLSEELKRGSS